MFQSIKYVVFSSSQSSFPKLEKELDVLINQAKELNQELETLSLSTVDLLGEPSGKYDYWVYYSPPPSANISVASIKPTGWEEDCSTVSITVY